VILIADETATGVSGCSTDSSVRVIKQIESDFSVSMFDRQMLAFLIKDRVQLLPLAQFNYAIENEILSPDSLYFNNTVTNLEDFQQKWIVPIRESWLSVRLKTEKS
jgi:hypothetical protein